MYHSSMAMPLLQEGVVHTEGEETFTAEMREEFEQLKEEQPVPVAVTPAWVSGFAALRLGDPVGSRVASVGTGEVTCVPGISLS